MAKVALKLSSKSVANLVIFARNVDSHMTDAADVFTDPPVTMGDLTKDTNDLENAQTDALNGNHGDYVARDAARLKLETDLKMLGNYVDMKAKGSEAIIISAGMEVKKSSSFRLGILDKPVIKKIVSDQKGTITLKWYRVSRSVNFVLEYTNDLAAGVWQNGTYSTNRTMTLEGLNSDTRYWVRVCALGKNGLKSDWSEPATRMVE